MQNTYLDNRVSLIVSVNSQLLIVDNKNITSILKYVHSLSLDTFEIFIRYNNRKETDSELILANKILNDFLPEFKVNKKLPYNPGGVLNIVRKANIDNVLDQI